MAQIENDRKDAQKNSDQATSSNPASEPAKVDQAAYETRMEQYKTELEADYQKSQGEYDKAVLSLSGGALGVSLVFLKDVVKTSPINHPTLLIISWASWAFSTLVMLAAFFLSIHSHRKAVKLINEKKYKEIYSDWTPKVNAWLNFFGGFLFFIGVIFMISFVSYNLNSHQESNMGEQKSQTPQPKPAPQTPNTDKGGIEKGGSLIRKDPPPPPPPPKK